LTIEADVADGGTLTYQWYSNTANNNTSGTAISGATSANYNAPTATEGTTYYYVIITNTNNTAPWQKTATTTSNAAKVTVTDEPGDGTSGKPFLVRNVTDLSRVGKPTTGEYANWTLDKHYKQVANIDLSSIFNWTPIGDNSTYTNTSLFTGSYDGGGYTISNLKINNPDASYAGLFGIIASGAIVKNVGLVDCNITGGDYAGGVVARNIGVVQNCYVTGTVKGILTAGISIGGVVGGNIGGTVERCYATGNVTGTTQDVGGVVGYNTVIIPNKSDNIVQNCLALNQNINTYGDSGRVLGSFNSGTLTNNYGRSDMKKNNGTGGWTNDADGKDGADITSSDWYGGITFWKDKANFDPAVWNIVNGSLPTLKNMPAGTQNPAVIP
jgi:hypothetical protein